MTTIVDLRNNFLWDAYLADHLENYLCEEWASEGVDYKWLDVTALRLELPDEVDYADVVCDLAREIDDYMESAGHVRIPSSLMRIFSLEPIDFLKRKC